MVDVDGPFGLEIVSEHNRRSRRSIGRPGKYVLEKVIWMLLLWGGLAGTCASSHSGAVRETGLGLPFSSVATGSLLLIFVFWEDVEAYQVVRRSRNDRS